jgi:preprotein translocase SecE subunit
VSGVRVSPPVQQQKKKNGEYHNELVNKVSWPTWAELQNSTSIVAIASVIIALMIFVMDFVFGINGGDDTVWKGVLGFFYELF